MPDESLDEACAEERAVRGLLAASYYFELIGSMGDCYQAARRAEEVRHEWFEREMRR